MSVGISFEICPQCGEKFLVGEPDIRYNQSRDIFYFIWRCLYCRNIVFERAKPSEVEDSKCWKNVCLYIQKYNRMKEREG